MNPIANPFAPGAGAPPPELAGRDTLREGLRVALERSRLGRPARSAILIGLRGVGKTVLLDRVRDDAEAAGIHTIRLEAPEGRSLPAMLAPQLRQALLRLSQTEAAKAYAIRGLRALAGFVGRLKLTYSDIEVGIDYEPEPGLADNGDLEHDLQALMEQAGLAAQAAGTALALFIDELQYVPEEQLAALITAMHRTEQRRLPVVLVGADGLFSVTLAPAQANGNSAALHAAVIAAHASSIAGVVGASRGRRSSVQARPTSSSVACAPCSACAVASGRNSAAASASCGRAKWSRPIACQPLPTR